MTDRDDERTLEWDNIKRLFHESLEQPIDDRERWVAQATNGNAQLRDEIESLLRAHETSADFMETPVAAIPGALMPSVGAAQAPAAGTVATDSIATGMPMMDAPQRTHVGAYRLEREIGRGGMGTVYLATRDDGQFTQNVALKLVKRGMDTDAILTRFRHERQILAKLEHPNIARLLDGGTTHDGVPYFVMEYVQGKPIREYCQTKQLTIRERITLFRTVCAAVQYAHQNLIVHRDIKSSNILVSDDGIPKLLDFGIAKVLHPLETDALDVAAHGGAADRVAADRVATETISALTPEYASPEQLRGEAVTTSTDLYSLGVLLYELLAGQRPFAHMAWRYHELVRAVCETDPLPPSAQVADHNDRETARALRGDLDNIVLMAIRKEPSRRYSSVERFSDDLARYLDNRPVLAQRNTWRYRTAKYIARNRAALAVGGALAVTMVAGFAATVWQARVAEAQRVRAERRFAEVRSLATTFLFDVHDEIASLPGSTNARALLVKRGLQSLDGLLAESQGDTLLERELSVAYQRLGLVQGNSYNANLGESNAALKSYQTAVQLLARSTDTTSRNAAALSSLALAYRGYADMLGITGDLPAAMQNLKLALATQQRAVMLDSANIEYQRALADLHYAMGDMFGGVNIANIGDTKSALASYRQSIAIREQLRAKLPKDPEVRGGLANTKLSLGSLQLSLNDSNGAAQLDEAVAILEALIVEFPNDAFRRTNLLSGYLRRRRPLAEAGRYNEALRIDQQVLQMLTDMVKSDPENRLLTRNLGVTYNTLGFDLVGAGRAREAIEQHRHALQLVEGLQRADAASAELKQDLAYTHSSLGDALREAGNHALAIEHYSRSLPLKLALLESEPSNARHPLELVNIYSGRGTSRVAAGDFTNADADFKLAVPVAERAAALGDATPKMRSALALLYARVGAFHAARIKGASDAQVQARCEQAGAWYRKSLEVWKALEVKHELPGAYGAEPARVTSLIDSCH